MGLEEIADHYEHGMEDTRVQAQLTAAFLTRTRDEWFEILGEVDTCVGKVYALDEVGGDPQVQAREMIVEMQHPSLGAVKQVGIPFKFQGETMKPRGFGPELGQHTDEVLESLGYSAGEVEALRTSGAVG